MASSDIGQNGQMQRRTNTVAADTVVLPNLIFGAYEALAARLAIGAGGLAAAGVHRAAGCRRRYDRTA